MVCDNIGEKIAMQTKWHPRYLSRWSTLHCSLQAANKCTKAKILQINHLWISINKLFHNVYKISKKFEKCHNEHILIFMIWLSFLLI